LVLALLARLAVAEPLLSATASSQTLANAGDIDAFTACFAAGGEMIDVPRIFNMQTER